MAEVSVEGGELVVRLSGRERLMAFKFTDIRFALSSITDVTVEANVWTALRGIRAPGTGIPGVIAYGTRRWRGGRDLALVRGGAGPGLRVDFAAGAPYARLVASVAQPEEYAAAITRALGASGAT